MANIELLTTKQIQDLLHIDRTTVYRMLQDGRLAGFKVGGQWRFSRANLEALLSGATSAASAESELSTDILPLHCIQIIQNVFAEVAGVGSVTCAPDGEPMTEVSNCSRFCRLILASDSGRRACTDSWRKSAQSCEPHPRISTCHAGLQYASARIEVEGAYRAALLAGQFYTTAQDPEQEAARLSQLARSHQLHASDLQEAARELPVIGPEKAERIPDWLEKVANTFEELARERANLMSRLRRIAEMSALPASELSASEAREPA